ncbi:MULTISPECIES: hypothetical protein [Bacillaceae]|uniref:hypothetical protein n=1 Tax=Bacillaceae TaxID=186817 RepID=UPI00118B95A5|nr:hypothetical protein [Bacillus sp. S3]QCJ43090.1 hypothetical protein FAY30_14940 [Bacillus sp. S3]
MSLKNLFLIFRNHDVEKELQKKLLSLEMNMEELKKALQEYKEQKEKDTQTSDPPIIIEKINIEKIILDKYELNNNFGQLGIKELKGKLNIGATYGSEFIPKKDGEEMVEKKQNEKVKKPSPDSGPKVNIYSKKEK